ncbi:hypothetical protein [Yoonia algicola]|uniref:Uncharacterized protein n=1 Tax=Yoonia algicola TaxID=3137368 RepID=A0AAN0M2B2_9RHOB
MLFSVNDLFRFLVEAEDFKATIVDVFVERATMKIKYLAVDTGGLLSNHTVVVSADRIGKIDPDDRTISLRLTKAEVANLEVIDTAGLDGGLQLSDIPSLILGPSSKDVAATFLEKNAPDGQMFSASGVAGSTACHDAENLGKVIGLIAGTSNLTVSHLAVDTGVVLPETQRVLPMSLVETVGDADTKTVLAIDAKALNASPQLENNAAIDRHWADKVATYYGVF